MNLRINREQQRILGALASSVIILVASAHAASPPTLIAAVERVTDGDTITAGTSNQT